MVVTYGNQRLENELYAQNARFLRRLDVSVPEILAECAPARALLIEDISGDDLTAYAARVEPERVIDLHAKVLQQASFIHTRGTAAAWRIGLRLCLPFSLRLYRQEHSLFDHYFLNRVLHASAAMRRSVLVALDCVPRRLLRLPLVLIHRDLQSSNIIVRDRSHRPVFIDFQGMRLGHAVYDIASLLCDPYASLPLEMQKRLLALCSELTGDALDEIFWWAAVQRLVQALGAYGRLGSNYETRRFKKHIRPALAMLSRALGYVPELRRLEEHVALWLASPNTAPPY